MLASNGKIILNGVLQRAPKRNYNLQIYDADHIKKLLKNEEIEERRDNLTRLKSKIKKNP